MSIPKALSPGECAFALHCQAEGLSPEREVVFAPPRKWRFDFYFPASRIPLLYRSVLVLKIWELRT